MGNLKLEKLTEYELSRIRGVIILTGIFQI